VASEGDFRCPNSADDAQDLFAAVGAAHQEVALDRVVLTPLLVMRANSLRPGKSCFWAMRERRHESNTLLVASMFSVFGVSEVLPLRLAAPMRLWHPPTDRLVRLLRQHVVAPRATIAWHRAVAMQGIGRDDAAFELQKFRATARRRRLRVVRARTLASAMRVCAAQAVTMTGGMWLLPRS